MTAFFRRQASCVRVCPTSQASCQFNTKLKALISQRGGKVLCIRVQGKEFYA
jgi:hypothetical protein